MSGIQLGIRFPFAVFLIIHAIALLYVVSHIEVFRILAFLVFIDKRCAQAVSFFKVEGDACSAFHGIASLQVFGQQHKIGMHLGAILRYIVRISYLKLVRRTSHEQGGQSPCC